jgi:hypothetical protein
VIYWSRLFIAIATGVGSVLAFKGLVSPDLASFAYVVPAILVYAATAIIYRDVLHYGDAVLKGKNRYITLGIGTFIFAWLAALVLAYTILGVH